MRYLKIFFFFLLPALCFSQTNPDSLAQIFHNHYTTQNKNNIASDTLYINYAAEICNGYLDRNDLFNALKYNLIEEQFYHKLKLTSIDQAHLNKIKYQCVFSRIIILERKESYNEALDLAFALLQEAENSKDMKRLSKVLDEVGYIYYLIGKYEKSLQFYQKATDAIIKTTDTLGIGISYTNLYGAYSALGDKKTAAKYCFSAIACFKKVNHTAGLKASYGNLALYYENSNLDQALSYALQAKQMSNGRIDLNNPGLDEITLGNLYLKKALAENNAVKKREYLALSKSNFDIVHQIAKQLNNNSVLRAYLKGYADLECASGNFESAYNYLSVYHANNDSFSEGLNSAASINSFLKYEFDKKEQKQQLLNDKKEAIKQKEIEKQTIQKNFFIIGFIVVSVFAILLLRSFRAKQKANSIILKQKAAAESQKQIIETKQAQLLQSINYAQRIQDNLLKSESDLAAITKNSFIIFKPRDIVSGDFYWFTKTQNNEIIVALADCTGHGVPGALLSMIGITALNEIVSHQKVYDPVQILLRLSSDMHDAFSKEKNVAKMDGMDFSVCKISPQQNKIFFAGVNQGVYLADNRNVISKIEPQVNSINGIFDINPDENIKSIEINLETGTGIYLFTDGIIDQIGETSKKKYLSARFEKSLNNSGADPATVKQNILASLNEWQGNYKQIDDITVIGIIF